MIKIPSLIPTGAEGVSTVDVSSLTDAQIDSVVATLEKLQQAAVVARKEVQEALKNDEDTLKFFRWHAQEVQVTLFLGAWASECLTSKSRTTRVKNAVFQTADSVGRCLFRPVEGGSNADCRANADAEMVAHRKWVDTFIQGWDADLSDLVGIKKY